MPDYRRIADRIADDIAAGRLGPGQRLPTQRAFARRHRLAPSTAGRVYAELVRRGLVVGEVGRGTFVRASPVPTGRALTEPSTTAPVNLELNYPVVEGQSELLASVLAPLLRPDVLTGALLPAPAAGTAEAREAVARLLATRGWRPDPGRVLFAGNGRQAVAAALASLAGPGDRVGVEWLTYPLVKEVAARLGVTLVPLAMDERGLRPDAVAAAHRTAPLSALYTQPTLHNPTSVSTDSERRRELGSVVNDLVLPVVEDRVWSFLAGATSGNVRAAPSGNVRAVTSGNTRAVTPGNTRTVVPSGPEPLAVHAPALTHLVDSLSKRVAPGLTAGFLVVPPHRTDAVAAALRSGGWGAARFALEAVVRWIADGVVDRLAAAKRADAARRRGIVARELAGFRVRTDPRSYYAWWELPAPWRADTFTAAAARHGIAVTPGKAFAVDPSRTPDAVRLGLASAPEPDLRRAVRTLADVARAGRSAG